MQRASIPRWCLTILLGLLAGCAVAPRLPTDVARAVNRDTMRVLRTDHIDLYYPADLQREAHALAERAEGCVAALRSRSPARGGLASRRMEIIFPNLPYNNAFVHPPFNGDFFSVIPTHWTVDIVTETGLLPDPGNVACHELTHYVQAQQTFRTWGGLNKIFGYVATPQMGLDSWFWEGLATYYENELQPGRNRLAWPVWSGMFHAAVAGQRLHGGDLSVLNRKIHWGNNYLYGSEFISFLVERYGEPKLWQLITKQGQSFFFPFLINRRFSQIYGKSLSSLIDEFGAHLAQHYPVRTRPQQQRSLRTVGMNGRYARAGNGLEAVVSQAMDAPTTLTVYDAQGGVHYQGRLTDVLPTRKLVTPSALGVSGLRFSRDGRRLYFVAVDLGAVFQEARLLELDLTTQRLRVLVSNLSGLGGDVSPDGKSYLFVKVSARGHRLARHDFASQQTTELYVAPPSVYLSSPSYSPDGAQIVVSAFDQAYQVWLLDAHSGKRLHTLSNPQGPLYDASFVDSEQLLFLGPSEGRFQAFLHNLSTQKTTQVTHAPYLAAQPRAYGGTVRFFNREGYGYTLDEVALPAVAQNFQIRTLADVSDAGVEPLPSNAPEDAGTAAEPAADAAAQAVVSPTGEATDDAGVDGATTETVAPADAGSPASPANPVRASDGGEPQVVTDHPQPLPAPATAGALKVTDDPYRSFPRILIPSVRAPATSFGSGAPSANFLGIYLGGTDALGKHRWGASIGVQPVAWKVSGSVGYLNTQLSPLDLQLQLSQLAFDDYHTKKVDGESVKVHDRQQQRDATLSASVPLRTSLLGAALHVTDDQRPDSEEPAQDRTLAGGTLLFMHSALERTAMSSARRGYAAALSGSYYPESLGTLDNSFADLRAELLVVSPLPFSRRHTLRLGLLARGMLNDEHRLLEVGGNLANTIFSSPDDRDVQLYPGIPPKRRFRETMRSFETYAFTVNQIGMGDLTYRYPLIIDRGTATSLWMFPSFFLRQIDFELFASGAFSALRTASAHLGAGAALTMRLQFYVPLLFRYQASRRLTDDERWQHLLALGAEL